MRRALILAATALLLTALPAAADSREWKADPPKQGTADFSLCTGYAEAGGHSYRNTNYIPNEILANCDRYAREDVVRGFRFLYGIDLDPAAVRVTVSQP
jgi:hypothetical protein